MKKLFFCLISAVIILSMLSGCSTLLFDRDLADGSADKVTGILLITGDDGNNKNIFVGQVLDIRLVVCGNSSGKVDAVSTNSDVLTAEIRRSEDAGGTYIRLKAFTEGESTVYVKSSDESVKSKELKITVVAVEGGDDVTTDKENNSESLPESTGSSDNSILNYILNTNTKVYHLPSCSYVDKMSDKNRSEYSGTKADIEDQGYSSCGKCNP